MDHLSSPVASLPFVGPIYANRLKNLNIFTINDLLHHYPFRYDDLSASGTITQLNEGEIVSITGQILSIKNVYTRNGKVVQKALFTDSTGSIELTWFNQPYLVNSFKKNPHLTIAGTVKRYGNKLTLTSPRFEYAKSPSIPNERSHIHTARLVPVYHETYGVSSKWLRSRISTLLKTINPQTEWLPAHIIQNQKLISLKDALNYIHFPPNWESINKANHRLSFDELLTQQLASLIRKRMFQSASAPVLPVTNTQVQAFVQSLPFTLTPAQHRVLLDIIKDCSKSTPANRLIQGDVGSGKTVLAAFAAYCAAVNSRKTIIMAPTQVLAQQHYSTIKSFRDPFNINVSLYTGSVKSKDKTSVTIGTHALLYQKLVQNVGVVIIDEQHRFGVAQRTQLLQQSPSPHLLSLTATPIPRTVALTLYAEIDLSVIDELPPGRIPVKTWVIDPKKRADAYHWIKSQIVSNHQQAYVVCPLIEESTTPMLDEVKAVKAHFESLKKGIFSDLKLGLLHGQLKSREKEQIITAFNQHHLDVLVSTPVIEVGIDVRNAAFMVIEGAQRFGLASLHQLRGRVGRGEQQSYCLLLPTKKTQSARLKALETTQSGATLAELDLKLRGPGELYGIQQSGYLNLKIASLSDTKLIEATQKQAQQLLKGAPDLHAYPAVLNKIKTLLEKISLPH